MDTSPEQPRNSISLAQTMDDLIRDQKAMFQAMNPNVPKKDIDQSCAQIDAETESRPVPIPSTSNVDSPQVKLKKSASTVSNFGANTSMHRLNAMRKRTKFDNERLDVREHTFHQKKAFKPSTVCGACGKTISFCASYLVCTDCHGVTHASDKCKAMLPKPCVPFRASKAGLTRMQSSNQVGRMVLLADFTETGSRPCVPALLIHCCNEIDRRVEEAKKNPNSLNSSLSGLYQNATAEKQAKELRLRILSGNGIPNLGSFELNVLCSVVKMFLRDMDDPVVTRIMWNDFVRASEHIQKTSLGDGSPTDSDYESQQDNESDGSSNEEWQEALRVLKAVVVQLPNANRDSLCFLFLHFYRILESSTVVKLSADDLSAVFAPMIVGSSRAKNSTIRLSISGDSRRESEKQITVMKAFFKLSRRFWEGLLKDPDFCPFETTVNFNLNCTQSKLNTSIKKISTSNLKMINDGGVY
ncbi:Rac GTPase-activating protein 1 [Tyrophagus putrescentiae]|nr:Rac GTPase-activating protein 1 [Tyrophagus putrescentiae]